MLFHLESGDLERLFGTTNVYPKYKTYNPANLMNICFQVLFGFRSSLWEIFFEKNAL